MFSDLRPEMEDLRRPRNWPFWPAFSRLYVRREETTTWLPSTDVYRSNGDLVVKVDSAGVKKGDVDVTVDDGYLVVRGERKEEKKEEKKEYFRPECTYGSFCTGAFRCPRVCTLTRSAKVHDDLEVAVPLPATSAKKPAAKIAVT